MCDHVAIKNGHAVTTRSHPEWTLQGAWTGTVDLPIRLSEKKSHVQKLVFIFFAIFTAVSYFIFTKNNYKICNCSQTHTHRQTNRQTETLITILCSALPRGSIITDVVVLCMGIALNLLMTDSVLSLMSSKCCFSVEIKTKSSNHSLVLLL